MPVSSTSWTPDSYYFVAGTEIEESRKGARSSRRPPTKSPKAEPSRPSKSGRKKVAEEEPHAKRRKSARA